MWGLSQPITGMLADRYGSGRMIAIGGVLYALGVFLMSQTSTPLGLTLTAGFLVGIGLSSTSFAVVLSAVGRVVPPERRGLAFGLVSALGAIGQLAMVPLGQAFLSQYGWVTAFMLLGIVAALIIPLAAGVRGRASRDEIAQRPDEGLGAILREAAGHSGYRLLVMGFFVCGFHVMFIATHLPAFLGDSGFSGGVQVMALVLPDDAAPNLAVSRVSPACEGK